MLHKTGVRVSATMVDDAKATIKAMPKGTSMRPSMPERKNSGMKLAMIIRVELRIGMRTSLEASNTTSFKGLRSPTGKA